MLTLHAEGGAVNHNAVTYEEFGAKGDGETDDMDAIVKAHEFANKGGHPVRASNTATYYVGGSDRTAVIQTDTDFGTAKFIIDDRSVVNRGAAVFVVKSKLEEVKPGGLTSLRKNQAKIPMVLPQQCVVVAVDDGVKRYIRYGLNQNSGQSQKDVFLVGKDGTVDPNTPVLWDFKKITKLIVLPYDPVPLNLKGGHFTTIANEAESKYTYYSRGISVRRSNVVVDGLEHYITGEGDHGAPYGGFINIADCANVTVKNCVLSGHKTYRTIGSAGKPVSMGTYDIQVNSALNVSFINCRQANDIKDGSRWGIMASNYSKNLLYDGCSLSRFDAHMGVANATIRNSTLGHAGLNAIGCGKLIIEDSTFYGASIVNMRSDYGSTWEGEFIIKHCTFVPSGAGPSLINGEYSGDHDFGYRCYMPERITIEKLYIDDKNRSGNGPTIFANFNNEFTSAAYKEKYPYIKTKEVILKDVKTASGKPLRVSDNTFMFKDVKIVRQ